MGDIEITQEILELSEAFYIIDLRLQIKHNLCFFFPQKVKHNLNLDTLNTH